MQFETIAVLGAGTIGMSWAALFAATGRKVVVYDPHSETEQRVRKMIETCKDALVALGWDKAGDASLVRFTTDPEEAVARADFIQESIPERLDFKHALYRQIEPVMKSGVVIGTSTSGLTLSEMQKGFEDPSRLILAHPFNPPHLIPLVELMGNDKTDSAAIDAARSFYESIGKVCVELKKEVPGHIANRIQVAVWREAIHLMMENVASLEDIDKAVTYGPGLRWAALGPNALFHLGGGEGGIRGFCDHLGDPCQTWWNDLGTPSITPQVVDHLEEGVQEMLGSRSAEDLGKWRDQLVLDFLKAHKQSSTTSE